MTQTNSKVFFYALLFWLSQGPTSAWAEEQIVPVFASVQDEKRFTQWTNEVRCVVCQGQSLAESNALLAKDLRTKIASQIKQHRSDADIKAYLIERYGEQILLKPCLNKKTAVLWFFPLFGLLVSTWSICALSKGKHAKKRPTEKTKRAKA